MAQTVLQTSFAAGELSHNLYARVDLDKYHVGAALMRNFFVDYRGGASTRMGTRFIDRTKLQDLTARLIPFVFSQSESYLMEFGQQYIRFYVNGAQVLDASHAILGISTANPAVFNVTGHGYAGGEEVYLYNLPSYPTLNQQNFLVVLIDANHFSLTTLDGVAVSGAGFPVYADSGLVAEVYEVVSPYSASDLPLLKYTQSADVMTLTHPDYAPRNLTRTGASTFSLSTITIGPGLAAPTGLAATPTSAGTFRYGYTVVAVSAAGDKSEGATLAYADSAPLDPLNATPKVVDLAWTASVGADHYEIYKWGPVPSTSHQPTFFGYIGQTTAVNFTDTNIAPDFSAGVPEFRNPFAASNYPGCVTYFGQRRWYGGLKNSPEELDGSKVGQYDNFDVAATVNDDDAIQIGIASRQVNNIKSLVPMASGLVVLTEGGAFQLSGGSPTAAITPSNVVALPQASAGANDVPPIVINYDILFVQNKGAIVRDLAYNFYLQTYYGFDRSALANHLFFGHQLLEWTYAEEPFKIVWAVREDGILLSLTYVPEQEVYGWARHDTAGFVESVCSVPEGDEDAVYVIVQRQDGAGNMRRYIERMASRKFNRVEDVWCLDSAVSNVLRRPLTPIIGTVVTAWDNSVVFTVGGTSGPVCNVGDIIWLDVGGKVQVTAASSGSTPATVTGIILQPLGNVVPDTGGTEFYTVNAGDWEVGPPVTTVQGFPHLIGKTVRVLADGMALDAQVVPADGVITLPYSATKILVGLPFQAQLQTLYLDTGEPTIQGRRKQIPAITLRTDQTRALKAGGSFDDLSPIKQQPAGSYTPPLPLMSDDEFQIIASGWDLYGQVCVQQDEPFPATVLGVIPQVVAGDNQG